MTLKDVAEVAPLFAPFVTAVVGACVVYVAYQQHKTAKNKLRLDLFDRRHKIYEANREFLSVILRETDFKDSDLYKFYAGISGAKFLFGPDVVIYLDKIKNEALEMRTQRKAYERLPFDDDRSKLVQIENDKFAWLVEQLIDSADIFVPYIGFSHVK